MASILFLEPYDTGSHAAWMRGYQQHSARQVDILSLPGNWWQWRMHGGAISLARLFLDSTLNPDLIVASDMLDLTTFLALTRTRTARTPTAVYFHENRATYPPGPRQKRDLHLGFINYASALAADAVFFNSGYHQRAFLDELPRLLKHYPDYNELTTIEAIRAKSRVLPLGIDLRRLDAVNETRGLSPLLNPLSPHANPLSASKPDVPIILWNHRWEYDKNPVAFFNALDKLAGQGLDFKVIIAGESTRQQTEEFDEARERLGDRIIHYGYAPDFATYASLLWQSSVVVSCAWQDFFGVSMCEAIYCGCLPILPRRLNYPDLIPPAYHDLCLYLEGGVAAAIAHHLHTPAPPELRVHVSQFDWSVMAGMYDAVFGEVIDHAARTCATSGD